MSYEQTRKDWEYLWFEYGAADDMTGTYVVHPPSGALFNRIRAALGAPPND